VANLSGSRQDLDRDNSSSITTRSNFGGAAGGSLPGIVAVAAGEPGGDFLRWSGLPVGIGALWRSLKPEKSIRQGRIDSG